MPTWGKALLGFVAGAMVGGAFGFAVLKYSPLLSDATLRKHEPAGLFLVVYFVVVLFGVPLLGALIGGIMGTFLACRRL